MRLTGHLTSPVLRQEFMRAFGVLEDPETQIDLLVDCREMTGYERDARADFVAWIAQNRQRLSQVAIVTSKPLWHMVIAAMSIAAGFPLRAFEGEAEAEAWLEPAQGMEATAPVRKAGGE